MGLGRTGGLPSLREVYRIGRGPSSSHTMAPERAAHLMRQRHPACRKFRVTTYGSLAATGAGHMTDLAIASAMRPADCEFVREPEQPTPHPVAFRIEPLDECGNALENRWFFSLGGGALADENGLIREGPPVEYPMKDVAGVLAHCHRHREPIWSIVSTTEPDVWDFLGEVWRTMASAVRRGLESDQTVLPGGLDVPRRAESCFARAQTLAGAMREISLVASYALAVAEENAAGGIVVAAPTCGASGVVPAILFHFASEGKASDRQILHSLATAGLFGASVIRNASVSGAEVGCQGEVGTACAMAAAAAAQILGGSPAQIEYAAEMAMEHHLGLTCDPIEGLVQIPCIERNAVAAMRALDCATFALLSDGRHIIPFDEVVNVMAETGRDLQSAYRETARGGLAEVWRKRVRRLISGDQTAHWGEAS